MNSPIGVAGLGFMGGGIARCLLEHGFAVIGLDPNDSSWNEITLSETMRRAQSVDNLKNCGFVIETISENFEAKQTLYDQLESVVGPEVPIVSNTSGFPISILQAPRIFPQRFAGMHWASPPYATSFLEIIKGDQTSAATLQSVIDLAHQLEKEPSILQKDVPGFIVNRLAYALYREALNLLESGVADAESIDRACRTSMGLWTSICGPFRWMDISGGPALYATVMETILPSLSNDPGVPPIMQTMKRENRRGTLSGEGFYEYGPEDHARWDQKLQERALEVWTKRHEKQS
jgi:3-hydroxybutyryl-CoA dehydrogenase